MMEKFGAFRLFHCFFWIIATVISCFSIYASNAYAAEHGKECIKILSADDIVCLRESCPGIFSIGGGVLLQLTPGKRDTELLGPPVSWLNITIMDRNHSVRQLPDSFYIGYAQIEQGGVNYWMIGEYTGGMHCCSRYHFFARPSPDHDVVFVGTTLSTGQGLDEEPFSCRDGALYLEDWDTRFQYFHTPYSLSILEFPTHYKITPRSLSIDNRPFYDQYLRLADELDQEILRMAATRPVLSETLLKGEENDAFFSDELGQLLVKRTILYLFAREDLRAWDTLRDSLQQYYQHQEGFEQIRNEINKVLSEDAY